MCWQLDIFVMLRNSLARRDSTLGVRPGFGAVVINRTGVANRGLNDMGGELESKIRNLQGPIVRRASPLSE